MRVKLTVSDSIATLRDQYFDEFQPKVAKLRMQSPEITAAMIDALAAELAQFGFILRGGFTAAAGDGLPRLPDGRLAASVLLVGNAGGAMWRAFAAGRSADSDGQNPLDDWTRTRMEPIAAKFGAMAVFPFGGPPWLPFQRWAVRADSVHPSPLGILIHPRYGLWHAYRAALIFAEDLNLPTRAEDGASPCSTCIAKPCLSTCPVGAFSAEGYDVPACAGHLRGPSGGDCRDGGCLARRACPVGRDYAYPPDEGAFHIAAFLTRH